MTHALSGKRVLVTGGTKGIGRATALAFAGAGAHVVTCYHADEEAADGLRKEFACNGHRVVRADVTDAAGVAALMDVCREAMDGLDVVVNNTGVDGQVAFDALTGDEWQRVLDANLTGTFLVTQQAIGLLPDGASIVNIGASVALRGRVNGAHYTATKAALIGLTRSLAKEFGGRGIRVNVVAPGLIETVPGAGLPPPVVDRIRGLTALGRLGTTADVTAAVLFLAGDDSRYITGTTLTVDGGM